MSSLQPAVAAIQDELNARGFDITVQELPSSTRTAAEAAATLNCEVGAIGNSLVFMADSEPLLVLASGAARVDTKVLKQQLGKSKIKSATPEQVLEITGQAVGGVSPLGHTHSMPAVIDVDLKNYETIWVAAGSPNAVFPVTFDELAQIANAQPLAVR